MRLRAWPAETYADAIEELRDAFNVYDRCDEDAMPRARCQAPADAEAEAEAASSVVSSP
jgi:hypothetical protein